MAATERLRLTIVGVPCATCVIPIRRALEKTEGIMSVGANYVADLILIDFDPGLISTTEIISRIKDTGYEAIPRMQ
ncbi:MAG: cation transporter [Nitrososphaerales archaeon]